MAAHLSVELDLAMSDYGERADALVAANSYPMSAEGAKVMVHRLDLVRSIALALYKMQEQAFSEGVDCCEGYNE